MGRRKNKADSLNYEDEEILWESGVVRDSNPTIQNHTAWFVYSQLAVCNKGHT